MYLIISRFVHVCICVAALLHVFSADAPNACLSLVKSLGGGLKNSGLAQADRESKSKISLNNSGYTRTISVVSLRGFKTNDIQIFYYWSVIKLCVERFPHFQYSHTSRAPKYVGTCTQSCSD